MYVQNTYSTKYFIINNFTNLLIKQETIITAHIFHSILLFLIFVNNTFFT